MELSFHPSSAFVARCVEPPVPAKLAIADWYKNIKPIEKRIPRVTPGDSYGGVDLDNLKQCMPFFDAMASGYIQKSWCDIVIKKDDEGVPDVFLPGNMDTINPEITAPFLLRRPGSHLPTSGLYYNWEFAWVRPWIPQTPKGYSILVTHPFNRTDLPFLTLTGIADKDKDMRVAFGQYPVYIQKDFEGVIPAGTPIAQFIPIKREPWKMKVKDFDLDAIVATNDKKRSYFFDFYKRLYWDKKDYS